MSLVITSIFARLQFKLIASGLLLIDTLRQWTMMNRNTVVGLLGHFTTVAEVGESMKLNDCAKTFLLNWIKMLYVFYI